MPQEAAAEGWLAARTTPAAARQALRLLAFAALWVILLLLYAYQVSWRPRWPASTPEEDAFISFRFAENLAEGYGPVFNRGGRPVEGYTNFLWVAWLAALHREWPDTVAHALGSGFVLGFLCLAAGYLVARRVSPRWAWTVPVIMAASRWHTENALTGLETMAYDLFFLLAAGLFVDVLEREPSRRRDAATLATSLLLLLAALTRFEGAYLFVLFSAFWVWQRWRNGEKLLRQWVWYGPFLALYVLYTGWRVCVFGELLPNTYYAKLLMTGSGWAKLSGGLAHVGAFLLAYPSLLLMAGFFLLRVPWRNGRPCHSFLLATVVAQLVLVACVGGDWSYLAPYWRLLSPVAPLLLVLGLACVERMAEERRRLGLALLLGGCLVLEAVSVPAWPPRARGVGHEPPSQPPLQAAVSRLARLPRELVPRLRALVALADEHPERSLGLWLRARLGPGGRVAGQHAGRIPYYSRLEFVDVLGYTDRDLTRLQLSRDSRSSEERRWAAVWEYLLRTAPDILLVANKSDAPAAYQALARAVDGHHYCLTALVGLGGAGGGFLLFSRASDECPGQTSGGSIEIGGRRFPLDPARRVTVEALGQTGAPAWPSARTPSAPGRSPAGGDREPGTGGEWR